MSSTIDKAESAGVRAPVFLARTPQKMLADPIVSKSMAIRRTQALMVPERRNHGF